jgi:hypothetical protein
VFVRDLFAEATLDAVGLALRSVGWVCAGVVRLRELLFNVGVHDADLACVAR